MRKGALGRMLMNLVTVRWPRLAPWAAAVIRDPADFVGQVALRRSRRGTIGHLVLRQLGWW
jgi:hypothetical protein